MRSAHSPPLCFPPCLRASVVKILAFRSSHCSPQFHHLQALRAVWPVVTPADDHVAAFGMVAMFFEIPAFEFELDPYPLPFAGDDFPLGLAVGKGRLEALHAESQIGRQYAEEEDHAGFVGWGVGHGGDRQWCTVDHGIGLSQVG